jgi:hypothetical protein
MSVILNILAEQACSKHVSLSMFVRYKNETKTSYPSNDVLFLNLW